MYSAVAYKVIEVVAEVYEGDALRQRPNVRKYLIIEATPLGAAIGKANIPLTCTAKRYALQVTPLAHDLRQFSRHVFIDIAAVPINDKVGVKRLAKSDRLKALALPGFSTPRLQGCIAKPLVGAIIIPEVIPLLGA